MLEGNMVNILNVVFVNTILQTCEVYKCSDCVKVFKNIQDLKHHFLKEHENDKNKTTTHMKQSGEDRHSFDTREYRFEDLFQM